MLPPRKISKKQPELFLIMALLSLVVAPLSGVSAQGDGFANNLVKFDGKLLKGKLDEDKNLEFFALGKWKGPLKVRFSPWVRVHFELVPFIETEAHGILGEYTVTFTVVPKTRSASYQNLRFKILSKEGSEIASDGVAAPNGPAWAIGIATQEKPFDIHVSYTSERGQDLTPIPSDGSNIQ